MRAWSLLRQLLAATLCAVLVAPAYPSESTLQSSSTPSHIYDAATLPETRVWGSNDKILLHFRAVLLLSEKQHWGSAKCSRKNVVGSGVTYDYDAFGNLIHSTGTTPNNYLYSGEQFDPDLNLYYNRARYLNTSAGRFWSMDSFEGDDESPASLHKYLYAGNNPINQLDPSGHEFDIGSAMTYAAVSVTNFAASVPYLLPTVGAVFAAVNVGLFITNEDYRNVVAANPDLQHAAYEDVALLFNYGGGLANAVFLAARGGAQSREIVVDLFGGASSQISGAINIDLRAQVGIRADAASLPIASESVDKVVASGPRAPFLDEASRVLKPAEDCTLTIRFEIRSDR
jgi:RHS repeat-associated protein